MKNIRIVFIAALTVLAGCATSPAPSDGFNDWTRPTAHHPSREQRSVQVSKPAASSALARASNPDSVSP